MEEKILGQKKQRKFSRFMKAPIKLLIKARDFYVKGMNECSDRVGMASVIGCPASGQIVHTLPRSYSVNSSRSSNCDEDYSELLRAASARGLSNNLLLQRKQSPNSNKNNKMPRSFSVGIGRIDEDKTCEFDDDQIKVKTDRVFPRSRSYAVGSTRTSHGVL
ncbi:hypothetical protein M5689_012948 [Euphorbia peplus]|nr:hypothetical protein M5689_012948 [Euphorbia peplus]